MKIFFLSLLITLMAVSCGQSKSGQNGQQAASVSEADDAKVKVYYFHGRMRCATCVNIQDIVQSTIEEQYAGNEDVKFLMVDFSDRANAHLADKYEIAFSSVVIATDESYTNLTDQAFAMVMNNPEGLKNLVADETNKFLNN